MPWLAWVLATVIAYVVCAAFFIGADPWDPLADWGPIILLVSSLALGLLGGRWPVLLAPLALILLIPLNRHTEPALFPSTVYWLVAVCTALIALTIGVRALIRRRGLRADRRAAGAGFGLLCLTCALTAWGIYLDHRVLDHAPSNPLLIDERSGAHRGIAPGAPTGRVRRLVGPPAGDSGAYTPHPLEADPGDLSGLHAMPSGQTWRYSTLVVFVSDGGVRAYLTSDPSAQTNTGVGIGDSLTIAERAYSNLDCGGVIGGSDAANPYSLACRGRLATGATISFGGDPIDNILVSMAQPTGKPPISRRPG